MAKAAPQKTADPARIRFIMVDAELPAGSDIGQITHAIQNALRPPVVVPHALRTLPPQAVTASVPNGEAEAEPNEVDSMTEVNGDTLEDTVRPRATRKAKVKTPKVLTDINLDGFADFADQKKLKSHAKRFLVVAAWLKQNRSLDAITSDHVYTCYRSVKWPATLSDFVQPLRNLKHKQFMESHPDGGYAINHLGLQRVDDLSAD